MWLPQNLTICISTFALLTMTIKANRFTPEVMLSAPRRSAGIPNADGSLVLYSVSTYDFDAHKRTSEIRVLNAKTNETALVTDAEGVSDPNWLDGTTIALLAPGEKGATKVLVGDVGTFQKSNYTAGTIDGAASNLKLKAHASGKYGLAVTAQAKPDGTIFNPETEPRKNTTGSLYKTVFVRHWDKYVTRNRNTIWYGTLSKSTSSSNSTNYSLSALANVLKGTRLESPVPPFGGTDHFDLSTNAIVFVAKDPDLNQATHTKSDVHYISLSDLSNSSSPKAQMINVAGIKGASTSPVFSNSGKQLAFLRMRQDGYESDKNQLFLIPDIDRLDSVKPLLASSDGKGRWDRSPGSIAWSRNDKTLYLVAEDVGRDTIYTLTADPVQAEGATPQVLLRDGAISDIRPLSNGDLFASGSTMVDNSRYLIISTSGANVSSKLLSSNTRDGSLVGLSRSQVSEIWWDGAEVPIQGWLIKPSNFDSSKKYPLAYVIHGGPQGSWTNGWSTRWNMAVFAEQGYVVVAPNPTGSTGFGQKLTDAIQEEWGGLPYQDLVKGFEYIQENLDYVDTDRAVALGASYGGYMVNWIQGQPLGREFKALVTHDGVFSMTSQLASEEQWFPEHDLGGKYWDNRDSWLEWDPSKFTGNWETPHLIIHSDLDYRLTIAEGLSAFNVLQDRGVESQFLQFPDENHWVQKPENSLLWHTVVLDWINGFVGLPKFSDVNQHAKKLLQDADQSW